MSLGLDCRLVVGFTLLCCACERPTTSAAARRIVGSFSDGGLVVEASGDRATALEAWHDAEVRFHVREDHPRGAMVPGLSPLAWFIRRTPGEAAPDQKECERKIRGVLAGRLAWGESSSLNTSRIVTLDDNASLSIVDPHIDSQRTKTLGMIPLRGRGEDLALLPDERTVAVTLPLVGAIAFADVDTQQARTVALDGNPTHVAVAADGRHVLVGDAQGKHVWLVDSVEAQLETTFEVGVGPHAFAVRAEDPEIVVTSPAAAAMTFVDVAARTTTRVALPAPVVNAVRPVGTSRTWLAHPDGRVSLVDEDRHSLLLTEQRAGAITAMLLAPNGRWIFLLEPAKHLVHILDGVTGKALPPVETSSAPLHMELSATFAWVFFGDRNDATLIDLGSLGQLERPVTASMVIGQRPLLADGQAIPPQIAPLLAPLARGEGLMLAHAADSSLHHVVEGMNAPMGSSPTYPWPARGVVAIDRTLREREPGVYSTRLRLPRPGTWDLAFLVAQSPRLVGCMPVEIVEPPPQPGERPALEVRLEGPPGPVRTGAPVHVIARAIDRATGAPRDGIKDLAVVAVGGPLDVGRALAVGRTGGLYEAELRFSRPGRYEVRASSASHALAFRQTKPAIVSVEELPSQLNRGERK